MLVLAVLFIGSVFVTLFFWVMATPGMDGSQYMGRLALCYVAAHALMIVLAFRYASVRKQGMARLALLAAPFVGLGFWFFLSVAGLFGFS